jgi:hypothetical protein
MIAFTDESDIEALKGNSLIEETLRSHYETIVFSKGSFTQPHFSRQQIINPLTHHLTQQYGFVNGHCLSSVKTVTDTFITKGDDVTMN